MKKYRVSGNVRVGVESVIEINANDLEDIYDLEDYLIDRINEEIEIKNLVGNGGVDKLIGVTGKNNSIYADCDLEINDIYVEEIK